MPEIFQSNATDFVKKVNELKSRYQPEQIGAIGTAILTAVSTLYGESSSNNSNTENCAASPMTSDDFDDMIESTSGKLLI